jgi:hypothetical protein
MKNKKLVIARVIDVVDLSDDSQDDSREGPSRVNSKTYLKEYERIFSKKPANEMIH